MTAVIKEDACRSPGLVVRGELVGELADARAQLVGRRVNKDVDLVGRVTAELGEELAHAPGVVFGVAELALAGTTRVTADDECVRRNVVRPSCCRQAQQDANSFQHGVLPPMTPQVGALGTGQI